MEVQTENLSGEIKRLQRCINDLVSLLALPAIWTGGDPSQVLHTLLDALMRMLNLDLVCVRLTNPDGESPVEIVRIAQLRRPMPPAHDICEALSQSLGNNSRKWPPLLRSLMGEGDVSIVPLPLGLQGELGVIVAAAQRADFPQQSESLLLSVAASQAFIGLQEARLRSQQKRIADDLDQRVVQRTAELAAANAELQLQVGLLQNLPVSAWTLRPDGTPDFVNQVWLEFSGQTLDFVRSHPEAWMTALHPEDREIAAKSFWDGVRSGQDFAIETRSLRARDGTYRWHLQQAVALRDAEGKVLKFVGTTTDIDDQKRAEEALRAREINLRRVIDAIPSLAWCNLPDGPNEFLSKGWHDYTGLSPEESHGWGWQAAFHPDDLPPLMEKWAKMLTSGEPDEIEARLRRHDGIYRWFLIRAQAFRDDSGNIVRWYGTSTDIEDRKRAEQDLRASETNLRQIVDCIPGLVCTVDAAGEIQQLNRPLLEYFGKTLGDLKGWQMTDAVHPDDRPEVVKAFKYSVTTGTPYDVEHRCRRSDGAYRWFQVRGFPARDARGGITGWYFLLHDIDDRKRAEERLRHSEALLAQVQSVSLTGGFSWSVDTDEITFSEEAYRIFGFERDVPVTLERIRHRIQPEDVPLFSELMAGARSAQWTDLHYEIRLQMPGGSIKYLQTTSHGIRDREGRLEYVGAIQDITRRKLSEEALSQARAELAHVSRVTSLGALTASIAHEINQPLSGIITNASTCLRMLAADPPQVEGARETARRTIRDGNRMSEVITRLRALFSKKEPTAESVNLNEAAQEVIALSLTELQKNRIILRRELDDDLPLVTGDRVQLQQVILNLLRNGSDAMRAVENHPRQLVIKTDRDEGDRVRLTVQDAGVGFDPRAADRLFDPFYTTKDDGMGIGLSVSRSIIERHNGRLWATLNDGPGATFSFSIPRAPKSLAHADAMRHIPPQAGGGPGSL
jgi:PAS domain S-box-containing protein